MGRSVKGGRTPTKNEKIKVDAARFKCAHPDCANARAKSFSLPTVIEHVAHHFHAERRAHGFNKVHYEIGCSCGALFVSGVYAYDHKCKPSASGTGAHERKLTPMDKSEWQDLKGKKKKALEEAYSAWLKYQTLYIRPAGSKEIKVCLRGAPLPIGLPNKETYIISVSSSTSEKTPSKSAAGREARDHSEARSIYQEQSFDVRTPRFRSPSQFERSPAGYSQCGRTPSRTPDYEKLITIPEYDVYADSPVRSPAPIAYEPQSPRYVYDHSDSPAPARNACNVDRIVSAPQQSPAPSYEPQSPRYDYDHRDNSAPVRNACNVNKIVSAPQQSPAPVPYEPQSPRYDYDHRDNVTPVKNYGIVDKTVSAPQEPITKAKPAKRRFREIRSPSIDGSLEESRAMDAVPSPLTSIMTEVSPSLSYGASSLKLALSTAGLPANTTETGSAVRLSRQQPSLPAYGQPPPLRRFPQFRAIPPREPDREEFDKERSRERSWSRRDNSPSRRGAERTPGKTPTRSSGSNYRLSYIPSPLFQRGYSISPRRDRGISPIRCRGRSYISPDRSRRERSRSRNRSRSSRRSPDRRSRERSRYRSNTGYRPRSRSVSSSTSDSSRSSNSSRETRGKSVDRPFIFNKKKNTSG